MGLNDQYVAIRTRILLMNPLHAISKVFSLVIQEERQRNDPIALLVANNSKKSSSNSPQKKDNSHKDKRPICFHCGIDGHIVDRCYKIHGYSPGYKSQYQNLTAANNGFPKPVGTNIVAQPNQPHSTGVSFFSSLNASQCSQLMELLNSQLQATKTELLQPLPLLYIMPQVSVPLLLHQFCQMSELLTLVHLDIFLTTTICSIIGVESVTCLLFFPPPGSC